MSSIVRRHFLFTSSETPMLNVVPVSGDDGPAAFIPVRGFRPLVFALEVSSGGVGVTPLIGNDEFSSWRGRLFAAAVSSGGG